MRRFRRGGRWRRVRVLGGRCAAALGLGGGPGRGVGGGRGRLTRTRHSLEVSSDYATRTSSQTAAGTAGSLRFSTINVVLLVLGLAASAATPCSRQGLIVAAPLLLVLGYVVLIPLGLILWGGAGRLPGFGRLAQLVQTLPLQGRGHRFESCSAHACVAPRRASVAPRGSRHRGACRSSPLAESAMPYDERLLEALPRRAARVGAGRHPSQEHVPACVASCAARRCFAAVGQRTGSSCG